MNPILFSPSWCRQKHRTTPPSENTIKGWNIADLFCGCGGLSLGALEKLHSNNIPAIISLAVDLNEDALSVYRDNFSPFARSILCGDLSRLFPGYPGTPSTEEENDFISLLPPTDLFLAGPPCQGNSDLNNHTRRSDPRNLLYLKAIRFIELTKPRYFIIENVPTVVRDKHGVVGLSSAFLEDRLQYSTKPLVIDSVNLGLAQTRKRHILLGARDLSLEDFHLSCVSLSKATLKDYIYDLIDEKPLSKEDVFRTPPRVTSTSRKRIDFLFDHNLFDLPDEERPSCHRDKNHSYVSMYGRLSWDKPSQTITSGFGSMGQGRYVHPERRRLITPHEAARIQGFPDYFDFSQAKNRSVLQEIIANAVPPIMAGFLVQQILLLDGDFHDSRHS